MFERIRKAKHKLGERIQNARAKSRHMTREEYRDEQAELKRIRRTEETNFRKFKISEDYRRKREAYRKRKTGGFGGSILDGVTTMGKNAAKNLSLNDSGGSFAGIDNFNRALTHREPKRRKKRKR